MKSEAEMLRGLYSLADADQRLILERFFPELKENVDERIKQEIKSFLKISIERNSLPIALYDSWITWLERQGEKNLPSLNEDTWLYIVSDVLTWANGIGQYLDDAGVQELAKKLCSKYTPKQEPVNNVEPKFKVGDWITDNTSTFQIVRIENEWYYADDGDKICFDVAHQYYRLWTIEDAKDGDVLASHECIVLFKEIDGLNIKCHCTYHFMNNPSFFVNTLQYKRVFHPATKERRDLLFKRMKEYGYKWEIPLKKIDNEDCVDLGLPSGTLWAKCNLGAEKETDFGLFYSWGDTQGNEDASGYRFGWGDYKFGHYYSLSKYNKTDGKLALDNEDDPVFVATDGMMRMPTKEQMQELIDHTNRKWIENFEGSGVKGMKFINKSDNTKYIFIPAAGYCNYGRHSNVGSWGNVWSTSRYGSSGAYAWCMDFSADSVNMFSYDRCSGYSVRGVLNK